VSGSRLSREYKAALQHPVFIGAETPLAPRPVDEPPARELSLKDQARKQMAERVLRFCAFTNSHWQDLATIEAAEILILLDLFVQQQKGRPVAVTDACAAAQVPTTSALRAIDRLLAADMIERHTDPFDARRKLLRLSANGNHRVVSYLDEFLRDEWRRSI